MNNTVIGLHGKDMAWLDYEGGWTDNIFRAERFESNAAALKVTEMGVVGVKAYTEPLVIAAMRYRDSTSGEEQK